MNPEEEGGAGKQGEKEVRDSALIASGAMGGFVLAVVIIATMTTGALQRFFAWWDGRAIDWGATGTVLTALVAIGAAIIAISHLKETERQNTLSSRALVSSLSPRLKILSARIGASTDESPKFIVLVILNEGQSAATDIALTGVVRVAREGSKESAPYPIAPTFEPEEGYDTMAITLTTAEPHIPTEIAGFVLNWEPGKRDRIIAYCYINYRSAAEPSKLEPQEWRVALCGDADGQTMETTLVPNAAPFAYAIDPQGVRTLTILNAKRGTGKPKARGKGGRRK